MKKVLFILTLLFCQCSLFIASAQDDEMMQKAQERFKNMQTLQADVTVTKHNTMVTKDIVSKGKFYFKKPSRMCLTAGTDVLLMDGEKFTMVMDGKSQTMSGNSYLSFVTSMYTFISPIPEPAAPLPDPQM